MHTVIIYDVQRAHTFLKPTIIFHVGTYLIRLCTQVQRVAVTRWSGRWRTADSTRDKSSGFRCTAAAAAGRLARSTHEDPWSVPRGEHYAALGLSSRGPKYAILPVRQTENFARRIPKRVATAFETL